jgi:tellurite resistance protein
MKPMPRIRRRIQKTVAFALYVTRSIASRRKLDEFTDSSPTVRALLAAADDRFSSDERRAFVVIEREREKLYARRDNYMWSIENAADPRSAPPPERQIVGNSARKASTKPHWGRFL